MPTAEILTIGTEILLGEIQDTNTGYLARVLKDLGVDLYRTQTVGDNHARIAAILKDILTRADLVITTGGLGPTVDDPTRLAVAEACDLPLEFNEGCWQDIQGYFARINRDIPQNNRRQAYLPQGSIPIHNPVGTAPGFILNYDQKMIISLPGVPKEMEHLVRQSVIPAIREQWQVHTIIRTRVLHVAGMGEASLDDLIGEYEKLANPTVGLLAKNGIVDIRIGAKADSIAEADAMIDSLSNELIVLLGDHFFGVDSITLPQAIAALALEYPLLCTVFAQGFGGEMAKLLLPCLPDWRIVDVDDTEGADMPDCSLIFIGHFDRQPAELQATVKAMDHVETHARKYAGPPENSLTWGINAALDIIRRFLIKQTNRNGR